MNRKNEIVSTSSSLPILPMMRAVFFLLAAVWVAGCAPTAKVTSSGGQDIASAQAESYNGPKARIAIADFEDKMSSSGFYRAEYGRGMSDMLSTSLFQTNRYILLEREKLSAVLAEQNLGTSGRVRKDTAAAVGEIEGAELMITAAITGFDPGSSGAGAAVGGGLMGNIIGGVAGAFKKAHVAMDIRVIDTRTSRLVAATSVEGSATSFGGAVGGFGGSMGGALGGFSKTPMETAMRTMIQAAVNFLVAQTPQKYYHFTGAGDPVEGSAPAKALASSEETKPSEEKKPAVKEAKAKPSLPEDEVGSPKAKKAIQTIRSDRDKDLIASLNEVKMRGSVLSVVISLSLGKDKKESDHLVISEGGSSVMDYDSGEDYPAIKMDGFLSGRIKPGEVKTVRATFKAPKNAKLVGITLNGLGTFDDVEVGKE